jgi:hypothetical protein
MQQAVAKTFESEEDKVIRATIDASSCLLAFDLKIYALGIKSSI